MSKTYFDNTTANPMYVGGLMIPPGEGRDVLTADLPVAHQDPLPPAVRDELVPSLDDQLADLLALSVKAIAVQLPGLSHEALQRLGMLERERESPRKSLLEALASEDLRRANVALESELDASYHKQLDALSTAEREALGELAAVPGAPPAAAPEAGG